MTHLQIPPTVASVVHFCLFLRTSFPMARLSICLALSLSKSAGYCCCMTSPWRQRALRCERGPSFRLIVAILNWWHSGARWLSHGSWASFGKNMSYFRPFRGNRGLKGSRLTDWAEQGRAGILLVTGSISDWGSIRKTHRRGSVTRAGGKQRSFAGTRSSAVELCHGGQAKP